MFVGCGGHETGVAICKSEVGRAMRDTFLAALAVVLSDICTGCSHWQAICPSHSRWFEGLALVWFIFKPLTTVLLFLVVGSPTQTCG
jgi:hypothetical protein